jgi:hypothetical protein
VFTRTDFLLAASWPTRKEEPWGRACHALLRLDKSDLRKTLLRERRVAADTYEPRCTSTVCALDRGLRMADLPIECVQHPISPNHIEIRDGRHSCPISPLQHSLFRCVTCLSLGLYLRATFKVSGMYTLLLSGDGKSPMISIWGYSNVLLYVWNTTRCCSRCDRARSRSRSTAYICSELASSPRGHPRSDHLGVWRQTSANYSRLWCLHARACRPGGAGLPRTEHVTSWDVRLRPSYPGEESMTHEELKIWAIAVWLALV